MQDARRVLILGLGNRLLCDDAAGPMVVDRLADAGALHESADLRDGGTLALALLPAIEDAAALVAIDAVRFGAEPGTVCVFEGASMDARLQGRKRSAHEVALADLLSAAALSGHLPGRRALVAVEPASTELGLLPSPAVAQAMPQLCDAVQQLVTRWQT
jgi:hydrogenase maturation protease